MGQDRNPPIRILVEKPQDELVNQRGLSRAARTGEANHFRCSMFDVRCLSCRSSAKAGSMLFGFFRCILDLRELVREVLIERFGARPSRPRFAVSLMNKSNHVVE